MAKAPRFLNELRGGIRLAVDGVKGVTRIVEGVHGSVVRVAPPVGRHDERQLGGIPGLVYRSIHGTTNLVGASLDAAIAGAEKLITALPGQASVTRDDSPSMPQRDAIVSALNGVMGDHLERTNNPLAIQMQIARRSPAGAKPLLLIHGLCMNDQQWTRDGHDHGQALAASLGFNPFYLRYNTGRHISSNGASLAALLEETLDAWPVAIDSFTIIGHSMGGLVARSAIEQATAAGMKWPALLRKLVFLGSPQQGAALERGGNWLHRGLGVSPYVAPFTRLSGLRSEGITDLRHGNLLDIDWADGRFVQRDTRTMVPLPRGVTCYAIAGTLGRNAQGEWRGDGLVSVESALGRHEKTTRNLGIPASRTWVAAGVNHLDLLSSDAVYRKLRKWLADERA
ncbi:alpha/beta hydrolase [Caenimonas koreensis DSM 17982]|uniref:Alpha/beta hydrolase n=1 Tax=Caenimonas koreensis DSM 17982 TaxID=1121255 RepID=A0A844B0L9_9BURK|nr:alpha/beta hydrolase [Caenimonas koreensis]MRD48258.1 alpha/beta hydrolase [Caenimonas koreensis DSM 17982]